MVDVPPAPQLKDVSYAPGCRNVGTWGNRGHVPSQIFQRAKSAFFVHEMKSALFVQTNVAVNTILTRRCPFCFRNFDVFKTNLVKNVHCALQFGMVLPLEHFCSPLPPQHSFSLFKSDPGNRCPPHFYAFYASGRLFTKNWLIDLFHLCVGML